MATFQKFYCFAEDVAHKKHNLGSDTFIVALTAAANPPLVTNTVLANLTQIDYTNCSSRTLVTASSGQVLGIYKLVIDDLSLSAAGGSVGPFRYVAVYNSTAVGSPLIGYIDYGSDLTLTDGGLPLLLDFSALNGLLQIQ